MEKHTKGKLRHTELAGKIGQDMIFHCGLGIRSRTFTHEQVANARRLAAAWNAVADFSTEELEAGLVEKMLSVCHDALHQLCTDSDLDDIAGAAKYAVLVERLREIVPQKHLGPGERW